MSILDLYRPSIVVICFQIFGIDKSNFKPKGVLALQVKYTPNYPDELPEFHVESIAGELTEEQRERIINTLTASVSAGVAKLCTIFNSFYPENERFNLQNAHSRRRNQ